MTENNPWQIVSETLKYDNPWIDVTQYDVINPAGNAGIYGKVHFKNYAIGILALDENLNTFLVGQFRFPIDAYSWEIPEGGSGLSADPLEGAKRELLEETGLVADSWEKLLVMHLSNSVSDEYAVVYLARGLEQRTASPEETEQLSIKKLPFSEAYQLVMEGRITDSITVAAILKTKIMIDDGSIPR